MATAFPTWNRAGTAAGSFTSSPFTQQIAQSFSQGVTSPASSGAGTTVATAQSGTSHHPAGQPGGPGGSHGAAPWDPSKDPTYQEILGKYAAMSQSERLGMDAAIARARAYYGSETDPLSLFGRLKEGYGLRDTAIQNALNARGMWRSGETGFGLNQSRLTYLRDELDYRMKLEDYINGLLATFAKSEQERQMSLIDWAWRLAQAQAASGTGGSGGGGHGGGGGGGGGGGTTAPPQSGTAPAAASTFVPYALQLARGTFGGGGGTAGAGYQPL